MMYWDADTLGCSEEVCSAANRLIAAYAEHHFDHETERFSGTLWDEYSSDGVVMDATMMEIMVDEYKADNWDAWKGCRLEGKPYFDPVSGRWSQDAIDEDGRPFVLYAQDGEIYLA